MGGSQAINGEAGVISPQSANKKYQSQGAMFGGANKTRQTGSNFQTVTSGNSAGGFQTAAD